MNILVTGAAGFLGKALCNRLVYEGHSVRGVDDLSAGNPEGFKPEVQFTRGDVLDRPKLWTLLQDVECVYHLAARVLVPESILYPREYTQVNVDGTVSLMEAMRDVGVRRVIFISSGAIYGKQDRQPLREDSQVHPRSPYAVSKLAAEYYVHTIGALWGIESICLRVFNAYGPGQQIPPVHAPVIPSFLRAARQNGTLVINGDGNQSRDYVYVDDVVDAMTSALTASNINQLTINIGSGKETTVRNLVRLVMEVTNNHPEIIYNPRNEIGSDRMCADLSRARKYLQYIPRVPLLQGLQKTLENDPRLQSLNQG